MTERTTRQLAGDQVRSLRAIRKKLLALSERWDGLDQYNMGALERLADQCETLAAELVPDQHDGELS